MGTSTQAQQLTGEERTQGVTDRLLLSGEIVNKSVTEQYAPNTVK